MIRVYEKGSALWEENRPLLESNPYQTIYFRRNARMLTAMDKRNYAIMARSEGEILLTMKVEPYCTLLFGSKKLVPELVSFLVENGYEFRQMLGSETICEEAAEVSRREYGIVFEESLAMDFMEATEKTEPSCPEVEIPGKEDVDELLECCHRFAAECGVIAHSDRKKILSELDSFRIFRQDGKILSMAFFNPATDAAMKINHVYTRPEARGRGLARKVVNTTKNEILSRGMAATLNVDRKNPISNHLYASLGFRKVFSQGEYRRVEKI